ncbi:hypothetical protein NEOKW01_0577 [Nematocida sp. AWRm80]|nr:hypothetical protein NEOKW01_0577 [Nematocida sp. AWRm80]
MKGLNSAQVPEVVNSNVDLGTEAKRCIKSMVQVNIFSQKTIISGNWVFLLFFLGFLLFLVCPLAYVLQLAIMRSTMGIETKFRKVSVEYISLLALVVACIFGTMVFKRSLKISPLTGIYLIFYSQMINMFIFVGLCSVDVYTNCKLIPYKTIMLSKRYNPPLYPKIAEIWKGYRILFMSTEKLVYNDVFIRLLSSILLIVLAFLSCVVIAVQYVYISFQSGRKPLKPFGNKILIVALVEFIVSLAIYNIIWAFYSGGRLIQHP